MAESWPILVPRESVNDDFVILVKWLVPNGAHVTAGSPIAQIETSKAVVELASEHAGYIVYAAEELDEVAVGSHIGLISSEPQALIEVQPSGVTVEQSLQPQTPRVSKRAGELIDQHGLDPAHFAGKTFVREQDVLEILKARSPDGGPPPTRRGRAAIAETVPLSPLKRTEIRYLTEGHREALLSAITVLVRTEALDAAIAAAAASRRLAYLDFIIPVAARTLRKYRELNAFLADQQINYYAQVNVGVALNMEEGLLVPVIRQADAKSPEDVSRLVADFAMRYIRGELNEDDLAQATFTVTDLSGAGAFHVLPLINRDQSAIMAIGHDAETKRLILTLGFDHRLTEGLQATHFLQEIKEQLEADASPAGLDSRSSFQRLVCSVCFNTLDRLREERVTEYVIPVVKSDGTSAYICPVCFLGWNT